MKNEATIKEVPICVDEPHRLVLVLVLFSISLARSIPSTNKLVLQMDIYPAGQIAFHLTAVFIKPAITTQIKGLSEKRVTSNTKKSNWLYDNCSSNSVVKQPLCIFILRSRHLICGHYYCGLKQSFQLTTGSNLRFSWGRFQQYYLLKNSSRIKISRYETVEDTI